MILRYNYLNDELDHEALIDTVPNKFKYTVSFETFKEIVGDFADTIIPYLEAKDYTDVILIRDPENIANYQIAFYFVQEEFNEIKKNDPNFARYMYHFVDRLAIDDEGNLYDIDDQEPASFDWYCYFLSTPKL